MEEDDDEDEVHARKYHNAFARDGNRDGDQYGVV